MQNPYAVAGRYLLAVTAFAAITGCKPAAPPPENMTEIPAGEFVMGSNDIDKEAKAFQYGDRRPWYSNERPQRKVSLERYHIDNTEVTNQQYQAFVEKAGHRPPPHWGGTKPPEQTADHPVVFVSWADADAYCGWKGGRLPTEAEWEKAARGTDGRSFPWGNDFDIKKVNTLGEFGGPTPVELLKEGASPYGLLGMAGNAQEWTADWYKPYPDNDFKDPEYGEKVKVVRGGGWGGMGHYSLSVYVRTSFRNTAPPKGLYDDVGFRCVRPK